ncbi:hypothetical protein P3U62_08440 [Mammaliicoccus vitulinus]|uniref:hypothetical protein n=1 Tax=Mammaliicoccus vitulinus TaxID=71237 RepID=UPI002B25E21B|nr:hypothetical protein [Mammaliicoccus vitulinus]WQK87077.1 hypothetical protein P3U62_08440 [Mammaliicoccus vitulinus]
MATVKESMKVSWKESGYKKTLSKEELAVFKTLNRDKKDDVVLAWINGTPVNLLNEDALKSVNNNTLEIDLNTQKNIEHLEKLGFASPSMSTITAFNRLNIGATTNTLLNAAGAFTTDRHKQLQSIFYNTQQSQMFLLSAQNDELIKQNERVIEQNEEIINLLQQIANK